MKNSDKYTLYDLISNHRNELMGIATLMVFIDHCWIRIFANIPILCEVEDFLKEYAGTLGVYIFVFLSGFGLPNSYRKSNIKDFYLKRFKRVYLTYFIAIVLYSIVYKSGIMDFVNQVTLLSIFNCNYYPYLWYVPAIMILYLIFPLIYEMYSRTSNKNIFYILSIIICVLLEILLNGYSYEPTLRLIRIIPIFIVGIISNEIFKDMKFSMLPNVFVLLASLVLFYKIENIISTFKINILSCQIQSSLFAVSFSLIYSFIATKICDVKLFKSVTKVLALVGSVSLEVYCLQTTIEKLFVERIEVLFGAPLTNIILFVIVLAVSYFLKKIIDYLWNSINIKEVNIT